MVLLMSTTQSSLPRMARKKNRLKESIELFKKIQTFQWLAHTTFILFLNKVDVFKEKLQTSDMVDHFTDYKGFTKDYGSNLAFVKKKFHEESSSKRPRMIYTHETCATDTAGMKFVFEAVRDTKRPRMIYTHETCATDTA